MRPVMMNHDDDSCNETIAASRGAPRLAEKAGPRTHEEETYELP